MLLLKRVSSIALVLSCPLLVRPAAAQSMCPQPVPLPDTAYAIPAPADVPLRLWFDRLETGRVKDGELVVGQVSGDVELRYGERVIRSGRLSFDTTRFAAEGGVELSDPTFRIYSDDAVLDSASGLMSFTEAGVEMPSRAARASAEAITISGNDRSVSLSSFFFTTCPEGDRSWELTGEDLTLDADAGFGTARRVKLRVKGVPVLYAPFFTFPLDSRRKSGFLAPNFAERDRTGLDVSIPYYWNVAPNLDVTLTPRYMTRRGLQFNSEVRYLLPRTEGQVDWSVLPDDDAAGRPRRHVRLRHETRVTPRLSVSTGIEQVSDGAYFEDLGSSLSATSQIYLDRAIDIAYTAPYWSLLSRVQNFQTIDPAIDPLDRPYRRLPQVLFEGGWSRGLLGFDSTAELVNFDRNVGETGWRFDSEQEISLRLARAGMYMTPAIALRHTAYRLDDLPPEAVGIDPHASRSLPVASLDAGLQFERTAGHGGQWLQTLEPRLLYVHIPYEDQSDQPVFDTILPDFNLVQLFRKYQYIGPDRIADTDQLSFGLTTRLIDENTGQQRVAATFGQTRYLSSQNVTLPDAAPLDAHASDYVAELSLGLRDAWNLDLGYQWNSDTERTARTETRFEYRPDAERLFGFAYRYRRSVVEQGDFSLVWPVGERWRVIGRYSYSFLEREPLEQFAGWEYESCCWRVRLVGRRFVSRRTGESDSSIAVQFELKGFSQRTATPEELLDHGILGYRGTGASSQ